MVLVVHPLITILNSGRIGGERADWRHMGLEALNRALHDLGVFALRHIGDRWERAGHLEGSVEKDTVLVLSSQLPADFKYTPPIGGFKFKKFVIKGLGQWIMETAYSKFSKKVSYKEYFAKKAVHLRPRGRCTMLSCPLFLIWRAHEG
ncbi:hypothetical protein CAEBREN_13131 [Caenorhabditis brenneri]|uniref:Uncharacterized protein n=1 Tax=Caenorhabditis brenneri TaxID=135651 RepID=G0MW23_CAEBE|nr:hypothetical protein CAEBREN_13131 [Caenorhabditis brenneri]